MLHAILIHSFVLMVLDKASGAEVERLTPDQEVISTSSEISVLKALTSGTKMMLAQQ